MGVPSTPRVSPVGISSPSTGVNRSASIISSWPSTVPPQARLKYEWLERLTTVALSVSAL